jgi:hypothetical protein
VSLGLERVLVREDLDRHRPIERRVVREVHRPHAAAAEALVDDEVVEGSTLVTIHAGRARA